MTTKCSSFWYRMHVSHSVYCPSFNWHGDEFLTLLEQCYACTLCTSSVNMVKYRSFRICVQIIDACGYGMVDSLLILRHRYATSSIIIIHAFSSIVCPKWFRPWLHEDTKRVFSTRVDITQLIYLTRPVWMPSFGFVWNTAVIPGRLVHATCIHI